MKNSIKHITFTKESYLINRVILSTGYTGIKAKSNGFSFLHCFINDVNFEDHKDILASGSTQEGVTNATLSYIKFALPSPNVLKLFNLSVKKYIKLLYTLKEQNDKLKNLKSFILPYVLTGFPKK